jgi:steroid 5-alpha reductase family enzyme
VRNGAELEGVEEDREGRTAKRKPIKHLAGSIFWLLNVLYALYDLCPIVSKLGPLLLLLHHCIQSERSASHMTCTRKSLASYKNKINVFLFSLNVALIIK